MYNIQLKVIYEVITNGTAVLGFEILVLKLQSPCDGIALFKNLFDIDVLI
jgi:hypothetical protein